MCWARLSVAAACAFFRWLLGVVAFALCFLSLPPAPPQHTSAAPHAADRFLSKRSGGQAVRGYEAGRSFMVCAKSFARWSALRTACAVQEWRAGAADFPHSSLSLSLAPLQHTPAAQHAADRSFLERSGGQAVRGSEAGPNND